MALTVDRAIRAVLACVTALLILSFCVFHLGRHMGFEQFFNYGLDGYAHTATPTDAYASGLMHMDTGSQCFRISAPLFVRYCRELRAACMERKNAQESSPQLHGQVDVKGRTVCKLAMGMLSTFGDVQCSFLCSLNLAWSEREPVTVLHFLTHTTGAGI